MLIEIRGPEYMLDEIRLHFEDELQNAGYGRGPRLGSMEAGTLISYVQGERIVSIQVTEETDSGETTLRIECESEIMELYDLWDAALINCGRKVMKNLMEYSRDKARFKKRVELMEIFPNWTLIPILFFVILLTFIINRLFIRPLGKVLEERHKRIEGARIEAEQIRKASQDKALEFERRLREARREGDLTIGQVKTAALSEKNQVIVNQRTETEKMLTEAKAEIRIKVEEARNKLREQAQGFAAQIASRILKRPVQGQGSTRA